MGFTARLSLFSQRLPPAALFVFVPNYDVDVLTFAAETGWRQEVIQHFSELFRLDQPGWAFPGWGCCGFGKKVADMPLDVTDCAGISIGASLGPVESTEHSR